MYKMQNKRESYPYVRVLRYGVRFPCDMATIIVHRYMLLNLHRSGATVGDIVGPGHEKMHES